MQRPQHKSSFLHLKCLLNKTEEKISSLSSQIKAQEGQAWRAGRPDKRTQKQQKMQEKQLEQLQRTKESLQKTKETLQREMS